MVLHQSLTHKTESESEFESGSEFEYEHDSDFANWKWLIAWKLAESRNNW